MHIDTGPGLKIEESHSIEIESYRNAPQSSADMANSGDARKDSSVAANKDFEQLSLHNGKIELPDWASDVTSILWIPIRAIDDKLARGSSSGEEKKSKFVTVSIVSTCLFVCKNASLCTCLLHLTARTFMICCMLWQGPHRDRALWME